jgi:ABC-2 type transport system permease protein
MSHAPSDGWNPPTAPRNVVSGVRPKMPDIRTEAAIFWQLRRSLLGNILRQAVAVSRLRVSLAAFLTAFLWAGLFVLFVLSFRFLDDAIPESGTHDETVRAVYSVFFASLTVMLVISTGIIMYSGLYRSDETAFLLTTSVRAERVFLHKFTQGMLFSSWGFLLLGSPMLVAYGVVVNAPWFYYALLLPFMAAFVWIPGSLGAIVCMLVVRFAPTNRMHVLIIATVAAVSTAVTLIWSLASAQNSELLTPDWFLEMLARLRTTENRLLPSWWLSSGLLEAARSGWYEESRRAALSESVMFLAVTISNALLLHLLAVRTAGWTYRSGYSVLWGEHSVRRKLKLAWIDRAADMLLWPLGSKLRLLVIKDLRLFRRDPVQWSQFLIFFGLLALYFLNTRRLSYDVNYVAWVNMISFLNLAVVGLILSTFTTRFIFPMISLEGRRFWILGRLPVRRDTILWSKYLFAAFGSLIPCMTLIVLSDLMLGVSQLVIWVHMLACVLLCSGLAGIAVGLGARMPNLREDSPARIAAGFGGTLNLVLSAAYIVTLVLITTVPCHFYLLSLQGGHHTLALDPQRQWRWLIAGVFTGCLLGVVVTAAPLVIGIRAFRRLET